MDMFMLTQALELRRYYRRHHNYTPGEMLGLAVGMVVAIVIYKYLPVIRPEIDQEKAKRIAPAVILVFMVIFSLIESSQKNT